MNSYPVKVFMGLQNIHVLKLSCCCYLLRSSIPNTLSTKLSVHGLEIKTSQGIKHMSSKKTKTQHYVPRDICISTANENYIYFRLREAYTRI